MCLPIKKHSGFTLIELLAVIAIIAVLSALLFPVGMRMRNKALETRCVGNLRQIATASACFSADNDGKAVYSFSDPNFLGQPWCSMVAPYLGGSMNNKVWVCAAQPHNTTASQWPGPPLPGFGFTTPVDYAQNIIPTTAKGGFPTRLAAAQAPLSQIVYLIEGHNVFWSQGSWDSQVAPYIGVHGPGINALFLDYHVGRLTNPSFVKVRSGDF